MKKINTDRILGVSAMVISILTLIIFIYQTNLMREQSKLSVKPRLDFGVNESTKDSIIEIQEVLTNKGLGPAIIDSIYIVRNEKIYHLNIPQFLDSLFPKLNDIGYLRQSVTLAKGSTLLAGESISIYAYQFPIKNYSEIFDVLQMESEDDSPFEIKVSYTSIYEDELWMASNDNSQPVKID